MSVVQDESPAVPWRRRPEPARDHRARAARKARRWLVVLALLLACGGTTAGVLAWLSPEPRPYFFPCWITESRFALLPDNLLAEQDWRHLRDGGYFPRRASDTLSVEQASLIRELEGLRHLAADDQAVVYLSAYTAHDAQGRLILWPVSLTRLGGGDGMPLEDVLRAIQASPARSKLLVLAILWPVAHPRLGILSNDAASSLDEELARVDDPDRLVLASCSPGQVALVSEDLGRTAFGYYFERGLRGAADGCGPSARPDGRVRVGELAAYLTARVDRWAARTQETRQTPRLVGTGPDFDLVAYPERARGPIPLPPAREYPAWLIDAWTTRDAAWADGSFRINPRAFCALQSLILKTEHRWRSGVPDEVLEPELANQLAVFEQWFSKSRLPEPPPRSLAMRAVAAGALPGGAVAPPGAGTRGGPQPQPPTATAQALDELLAALDALPPQLPHDKAAAAEAPLLAKFQQAVKDQPADDLAQAVFSALAADLQPSSARVALLDELLRAVQPQPRFVETQFLRDLAELGRSVDPAAWPAQLVHRAVGVVQTGEAALAWRNDPHWGEPLWNRASGLRHQAERLLLSPGFAEPADAQPLFDAAESDFRRAEVCLNQLAEASRLLDVARARLPHYLPLINRSRSAAFVQPWLDAAATATTLADQISDEPPTSVRELKTRVESVYRISAALADHLAALDVPLGPDQLNERLEAARQSSAGPLVQLEIEALLDTGLIPATQRAALWEASRALGTRVRDEVLALDDQEDQSHRQGPRLPPLIEANARREQNRSALTRAQLSLAMLKLAGLPQSQWAPLEVQVNQCAVAVLRDSAREPVAEAPRDESREALQTTLCGQSQEALQAVPRDESHDAADPTSPRGSDEPVEQPLHRLAAALRATWMETLPEEIVAATNPAQRDRLARLWFGGYPLAVLDDPRQNPAVVWRSQQAQARWQWLGLHDRFVFFDGGAALYADLARAYLDFAAGGSEALSQLDGPLDIPQLRADHPTAQARYSWRAVARNTGSSSTPRENSARSGSGASASSGTSGSGSDRPRGVSAPHGTVDVCLPCDALQATVSPVAGTPNEVLLQIALRPGYPPSELAHVAGVLLRLHLGERTYHRPVTLSELTARAPIEIVLSADPAGQQPLDELRLRPTASPAPCYLFVRNVTTAPRQVAVGLSGVPHAAPPLVLAPGQMQRVVFAGAVPLPGAVPPAGPAPPSGGSQPPGAALPALEQPLEVTVTDVESGAELARRQLLVEVVEPQRYVRCRSVAFDPGTAGNNRLSLTLEAVSLPDGPPCIVSLDLPPAEIPGLEGLGGGALSGTLPATGGALTLVAEKLRLDPSASENGRFYVTVDGCRRAFSFRTTFARQGEPTSPQLERHPRLHLSSPTLALSSGNLSIEVGADQAPLDATIEVSLRRADSSGMITERVQQTAGPRWRRIGFAPTSPDGAMLVEAAIRDWELTLPTSGIVGRRQLMARLLDAQGRQLAIEQLSVTLDDSPPEVAELVHVPTQVLAGAPVTLEAWGHDQQSGLTAARFFAGAPVAGAVPSGAAVVDGQPLDDERMYWSGVLHVPSALGPLVISVELVNGVGLSRFATATVEVVGKLTAPPGRIAGEVLEGSRPQPGLVVLLVAGGAEKARTTTDASGRFVFEGVEPGAYTVEAAKPSSMRKGQAAVTVTAGETAAATVKLAI